MNDKYEVTTAHLDLNIGEIVEEFLGNTYGFLSEDERGLKTQCVAVNRIGQTPFRIIPTKYLTKIKQ